MKVRCRHCGCVTRIKGHTRSGDCPVCGHHLSGEFRALPACSYSPTCQTHSPSKGRLCSEDRAARNVGFLIIGILLFGIPTLLAGITQGDDTTYWALVVAALVALIPLGVWFEKQTIRRG
jgi:hypothetical protein